MKASEKAQQSKQSDDKEPYTDEMYEEGLEFWLAIFTRLKDGPARKEELQAIADQCRSKKPKEKKD